MIAQRESEGFRQFVGCEATTSTDYAMEAERETTESGMARHELDSVLKGQPITAIVPPHRSESLVAYGLRATGEILVRYLIDDEEKPLPTD